MDIEKKKDSWKLPLNLKMYPFLEQQLFQKKEESLLIFKQFHQQDNLQLLREELFVFLELQGFCQRRMLRQEN